MININISTTGFVSGDAWERVAYQGEINSRTIHTVHPFDVPDEDEVYGYNIRCFALGKVKEVYLDEDNNAQIPSEFMANAGTLDLQFFIKVKDSYKMLSNMFSLFIEPSIEITECRLKPGAENFIVVETMLDREKIPVTYLADGKVVKVNDSGNGVPKFFQWNRKTNQFEDAVFGDGITAEEALRLIENKLEWEHMEVHSSEDTGSEDNSEGEETDK